MARGPPIRLRKARRRKASSNAWLRRQLNDPYVAEARRQGYRSRAAFKLLELDDRFCLLRPAGRVVDLGCSPGGWTQVAVARTAADQGRGVVVGIDLVETQAILGAVLLRGDFREPAMIEAIASALGGGADLVLSDMAAPATGHAATDHLRIVALAEDAFAFARGILEPGGGLLVKLFQGGGDGALLAELRRAFAELRHAKPAASRADSAEIYLIAMGFRGLP